VVFSVHGIPLESVSTFKYLGRLLSSTDDDWPTIYKNLSKARKRWGMVSRLLVQDNADPKTSGIFYKAIVQSILLYGSETWVVTPSVLRVLESFHNRVARRISGLLPRLDPRDETWYYPPIADALEIAGLFPISHYIQVRQNTLIETVATRPILELCKESVRRSGSPKRRTWWEQFQVEE
jgi:hypothetical protein